VVRIAYISSYCIVTH